MIETKLATGTKGFLIVQDNTDGADKTVDLYLQCTTTKAIPNLPWGISREGAFLGWRSFNFTDTVLRQHLGLQYVGDDEEFTLHLGNTGTVQMGGPTDLTVSLNQHGVRTVSIFVGGVWKSAVPYVNVGGVDGAGGVWKATSAYVMKDSKWEEAT